MVFSLLFTFLPLTVSASENPEYPNEGCWNLATVTENGYTLDIYDKGHNGVPNALAVTDADMLAAAQNGTVTVQPAVCRHEDASGCGICDLFGADLHELQENCTHLCHKAQKNSIFRFVWKLLRVLYKVFKIEEKEFCACGVKH